MRLAVPGPMLSGLPPSPAVTSRDPATFWTSGQWMTEKTGGSDVGLTQTVARQSQAGWRLYGTKWFTSATTAQMALTLARPEGNGPGGKGLALFYVVCGFGAVANVGVASLLLVDDLVGWRWAGAAGALLTGVWNYAVSSTLVWRAR